MSDSSHPAYRPDIDGLRAVAVLSVLAFHALPQLLPGGFVGVDIFFVISGYLISSIILKGLAQGRFSYFEFYGRRIKRIFPALIAMLVAVWIFGWLMLFPDEYRMLGKHIAAGTAFLSNVVLWKESGYFDTTAELKPLLHLWSLGIEEQFYIVWPLFLAFTWRWRHAQFAVICAGLVGSFALNVLRVKGHPTPTFYLPPTRFWELLIGCVLAYSQLFARERLEAVLGRWRNLQAVVGLALIVAALALLNRHSLFPGWWALLPTVGAVLLIAAGPGTWVNRHVLANRPMVFVGLISYPLYLWHWPLLSYLRIVERGHVGPLSLTIAVALAFVLAIFTYYFIEKPIRSPGSGLKVAWPLLITGTLAGAVAFASFLQAFPPRSARYGVDRILAAANEDAFPGPRLHRVHTKTGALFEQGTAPRRVLFFGDSNIEQYYPRVDKLLSGSRPALRSAAFVSMGGCPPLPNVHEDQHPGCEGQVALALNYAHDPRVDTVVIGASWNGYFIDPDPRYDYYLRTGSTREPIRQGASGFEKSLAQFEAMVGALVQAGKRVFIILQIPVGDNLAPRAIVQRGFTELSFRFNTEPLDKAEILRVTEPVVSRLVEIAQRTGAAVIDPLESLCDSRSCPSVTPAGEPMYRDAGHLRPTYVRDNVQYLDAVLTERLEDRDLASPDSVAATPGLTNRF